MIITNSALFKDLARPVLQPAATNSHGTGIMDHISQYLLKRSKLEVLHVKIFNATEKTCELSIECRVTSTGPVSSIISPMELDLVFNDDPFSKMTLPEIKTSFWGTKVLVKPQRIEITDMTVYHAFVRSVMDREETVLNLDNGDCHIKSMGFNLRCKYSAAIPMRGMEGVPIELKSVARGSNDGIAMTFEFTNNSPVEIEYGTSFFSLMGRGNHKLADLKGDLSIVHGKFQVTLSGTLVPGAAPTKGMARLVGSGTEEKTWCDDTIKFIDKLFALKGRFVKELKSEREAAQVA